MDEAQVTELLRAVFEIRDLLRLSAEPAIAERDKKSRSELRRIIGSSATKKKAVLLMDGSRTQRAIRHETGMNQGNLSTLVKRLKSADLISGDGKEPKLSIPISESIFKNEATHE